MVFPTLLMNDHLFDKRTLPITLSGILRSKIVTKTAFGERGELNGWIVCTLYSTFYSLIRALELTHTNEESFG